MNPDDFDNSPLEDDKPAADPMAKARAVKAAKALAKAMADQEAAEQSAAPVLTNQPVISTLKTKSTVEDAGPMVLMEITVEGHGQISTGGEFGFERYAMDAQVMMPELYARQNYKKHWAQPMDRELVKKWKRQEVAEYNAQAMRKRSFDHVMENGVSAGEYWSADR